MTHWCGMTQLPRVSWVAGLAPPPVSAARLLEAYVDFLEGCADSPVVAFAGLLCYPGSPLVSRHGRAKHQSGIAPLAQRA